MPQVPVLHSGAPRERLEQIAVDHAPIGNTLHEQGLDAIRALLDGRRIQELRAAREDVRAHLVEPLRPEALRALLDGGAAERTAAHPIRALPTKRVAARLQAAERVLLVLL